MEDLAAPAFTFQMVLCEVRYVGLVVKTDVIWQPVDPVPVDWFRIHEAHLRGIPTRKLVQFLNSREPLLLTLWLSNDLVAEHTLFDGWDSGRSSHGYVAMAEDTVYSSVLDMFCMRKIYWLGRGFPEAQNFEWCCKPRP